VLTCLGISLLCIAGSDGPAKQAEKECFEGWLQSQRGKLDKNLKLSYAPFNKEEWESKGYPMPRKPTDKRMAMLGQGGDMTAYRMKNDVGELFAVKIVELDRMTTEEVERTRKHVEREARTLQRLTHTYVIRYHGMYEDEDEEEVGVVMELAQGGSLAELIKAREERGENVGMAELLDMSIQMAEALDYVHGQGIVHRDVKAENVLLASAEGRPVCIKLADFGVAAVLTHTAGTKRRSLVGTDEYLSPEQAMSEPYGRKADMWALGCILVELASCRRLHGSLWANTVEVNDRRNKYLIQVHERGPVLGDIAKSLLDRDATSRLSALELRVCLDKLKKDARVVSGHNDLVRSVCFSPCGTKIVSGGGEEKRFGGNEDFSIRIWDAETGTRIGSPLSVDSMVRSVAFSPDGSKIAAAYSDEIQIFDAQTQGKIGSPLTGHTGWVTSVCFDHTGKKLASGGGNDDNSVRLWSTESGAPIGSPLSGHNDPVWSVCFSPCGTKIVSGGGGRRGDFSIRIWDAETGTQVGSPLTGHSDR
jgi:serine/threonine protein kinase